MRLEPPLSQVAFSVVDLAATERWFREGLGFWPAGGSRAMMRGPLASSVQGLPRAASTCWWLVDRNEWFQLELFQFERPLARLMPDDFRPCDIGYTRIGVWVADFDEALTRLERLGSSPLSAPVGATGARRACVRNPDGVYVEIMEDDPLSGAGLDPGSVGLPGRAALGDPLGPGPGPIRGVLQRARPQPLGGGAAGTRARGAVGACRGTHAEQPVLRRQRPRRGRAVSRSDRAGSPDRATGSRIKAILNIAFGVRTKRTTPSSTAAHAEPGRSRTGRPLHVPGAGVTYVNDPQQFSVELLWTSPASDRRFGFTPRPTRKRPNADTRALERSVRIAAPMRGHVGCDHGPREHGRMDRPSARSAGPSTARRSEMVADLSGC